MLKNPMELAMLRLIVIFIDQFSRASHGLDEKICRLQVFLQAVWKDF